MAGGAVQRYDGRTRLPFVLEPQPGARTLLVVFPKVRPKGAKPPVALRPHLEGIDAHRLYVGADEHKFIGPDRRLDGLLTAVDLVRREAESLQIPSARVVCAGTSMGAVLALMTGLISGAGRIVAGAAPVRMGTAVAGFLIKEGVGGIKARAATFVEVARSPDGGDPVEFLDGFIFDLARECATPCRIDLLVSARDYANASVREFAVAARTNPNVQVELWEAEYPRHGAVGQDFYPLLRRLLGGADEAAA